MPFASDPVNFWIKLVTRFRPPLATAAASDDRHRASGPPAPGLSFHRSCGGRNQAGPARVSADGRMPPAPSRRRHARPGPLRNHVEFEFGDCTDHRKYHASHRRFGIDSVHDRLQPASTASIRICAPPEFELSYARWIVRLFTPPIYLAPDFLLCYRLILD
jgi:hypothetical protein